jgi:hypothetical protein
MFTKVFSVFPICMWESVTAFDHISKTSRGRFVTELGYTAKLQLAQVNNGNSGNYCSGYSLER